MGDWMQSAIGALPWGGLVLLALIFVMNALGVLDQRVAVRELAATGVPEGFARVAVQGGRVLQAVATPLLFWSEARPIAALLLAGFLVGATVTAHAFWKAGADERDRQLVSFLKNVAIIGGLLVAAGWRGG